MSSVPARLGTYASWHHGKMYPPEKLAGAGLFCLTGEASKVTCFHSGKTFSISSEKYADPWEEHTRHCHSCPFLLGLHRPEAHGLLQGTKDGTLKTRPGKGQQAATLGIPTAVQASSSQQTTEASDPTPTTLVPTASTSRQQTIVTAPAEDTGDMRQALGTDNITTGQHAVIHSDLFPSSSFDFQESCSSCIPNTSEGQSGKDIVSISNEKGTTSAEAASLSDQPVLNSRVVSTRAATDEQVAERAGTVTTRVQSHKEADGQLRGKGDQRAILANLSKRPGESLVQCSGTAASSTLASPPNTEYDCQNYKEETAIHERAYSNECTSGSQPKRAAREVSTASSAGSENNKEIIFICVSENTDSATCAQDTLVSRQEADVENAHGDRELETVASIKANSGLSIHQPKENEQSVQGLVTAALRGADQQTDVLLPRSPKSDTGPKVNQHDGDITVSRKERPDQEVSGIQHEAGPCKDCLAPGTNRKGPLTTGESSQCTEEAVAPAHDEHLGFDHTDVVSTVGNDCTDDNLKLPVQEVGDSNTESSSQIRSSPSTQRQIQPQFSLSHATENAESGDIQVENIKPMYVNSRGESWHPEQPLSEGVQDSGSGPLPVEDKHCHRPDTSSSTSRQQNTAQAKHQGKTSTAQGFNKRQQNTAQDMPHQGTSTVQVFSDRHQNTAQDNHHVQNGTAQGFNNSWQNRAQDKHHQKNSTARVFNNRQQHTACRKHHGETSTAQIPRHRQQKKESAMTNRHQFGDHEEATSLQSLEYVHCDCNRNNTCTSHLCACGYAAHSCHQEHSKNDAIPENMGGYTDSEEEDESDDEDHTSGDGADHGFGDADGDDGSDDSSSSSSDDDDDDAIQPYAHSSNIYAGVDIDLREGSLPCLHCRRENKQVLLPCSHKNLCYVCFFCKSYWRHHLLHGPPRCLLCGESFTDIKDPLLIVWALAFNRRPKRVTNCGCGSRRG